MKKLWHFLRTPSRRWSVLALILVGVGVTLAGSVGLHYGFEKTSSLEFCVSCHSMESTVYQEYKESIHYKNASGVQAVCTDCHQPKDFVGKVARKMEAANDLYQEYIGHSIDTQEKFEDRRLHLAEKVWARMSSQNSKTCKSCHSYDNMDHARQSPAAALAMQDAAAKNMNCIECHKGIAHELPNMAGGFRATFASLKEAAQEAPAAEALYTLAEKDLYADEQSTEAVGKLLPASRIQVLARSGDRLQVAVEGWREQGGKGRVLSEYMGKRVFVATLRDEIKAGEQVLKQQMDEATQIPWEQVRVQAWVDGKGLESSLQPIWDYAGEMYKSTCNSCHAAPNPAHFTANGWISGLKAMSAYYRLSKEEERTLLKYLQNHAADTGGQGSH
ncbi:pentaheme c-type cytochrome TorC [Aeromonas sp. MR16]|uniref:pentaheme c-type cytochrome TorC n=1 Tax=Aeromonas sp. MR16 TaxID=2923420 RepID=UPI001F4B5319|nr:pentaheme c-type cytochrome TorC [Aeromonas sp. MR16]MCH7372928.1 pentaheme c-type cytochrome TorC [Aeromonas sp. MR16]